MSLQINHTCIQHHHNINPTTPTSYPKQTQLQGQSTKRRQARPLIQHCVHLHSHIHSWPEACSNYFSRGQSTRSVCTAQVFLSAAMAPEGYQGPQRSLTKLRLRYMDAWSLEVFKLFRKCYHQEVNDLHQMLTPERTCETQERVVRKLESEVLERILTAPRNLWVSEITAFKISKEPPIIGPHNLEGPQRMIFHNLKATEEMIPTIWRRIWEYYPIILKRSRE